MALAHRADAMFAEVIAELPSADDNTRQEVEMEVAETKAKYDLGHDSQIPLDLYATKVAAWFQIVESRELSNRAYLCQRTECPGHITIEEFDRHYRGNGRINWLCDVCGDWNSVLPTSTELDDVNR